MPAFAFDTLKAMRALAGAGMQEPVAEAVVTTMNDAVTGGVAAKADIAQVNGRLDVPKAEISSIGWMLGLLAAAVLLIAGRLFGAL